MATVLTLQKAAGALSASANTVVLTVADGYTVMQEISIANTGSSDRLITVEYEGTRIFTGHATNSPLKPGMTLEIRTRHRLEEGDEITIWQDSGTDCEYYITVGVVPVP